MKGLQKDGVARPRDSIAGVRIALDARDHMGETPIWSEQEKALYWINVEEPAQVRRWDPVTGALRTWPMPERVGGIALRRQGNPIVCLGSGVYNFDRQTGGLSLLAPSPYPPTVKLHESCVDPSGRLWIGSLDTTMGPDNPWPGQAGLCRLEGKQLVRMAIGMTITNSFAFSADGRSMYFCDTLRRVIWRAEVNGQDGSFKGIHEYVRLEQSVTSDGAAVDSEGGYWLAIFGGGEVRRYLPDGSLDRAIQLPLSQPTKVAFGGDQLRKIYVTSTRIQVPGFPVSGCNGALLEIEGDVPGLPENYFAG